MMKKSLLLLSIFACLGCNQAPATTSATPAATEETPLAEPTVEEDVPQERRDVLYYYRRLKEPYRSGYELKENKGQWTSMSPDTEEPIAAV
ncbi:MAG TPA: hypothetical protein PLL53_15505, partial [Saprospiraceae bacterium]|nr:hypothetical protein [Saprospiraceae bacterium]